MPRTKVTRKAKSVDGSDEANTKLKDFEKHLRLRLHKMEQEYNDRSRSLATEYGIALSRLPPSITKMTLREILKIGNIEVEEDVCEVSSSVNDESISPVPKTVKSKRTTKRTTTASDDGYMTEVGTATTYSNTTSKQNHLSVPTPSKTRNIRTRSSSDNQRAKLGELVAPKSTRKQERAPPTTAAKNRFKTPALVKHRPNEYALVTPKVGPNTPMSVLRRPRQGEMALSMQGSPLLVTPVVEEHLANINVPMENGRIISFLPTDGLRLSCVPTFDAETRRQLLTLKHHLEKVVPS